MENALKRIETQLVEQDKVLRNLNSKVDSALQALAALAVKIESIIDRLPDGIRSTKSPVAEEVLFVTETAPPAPPYKDCDRQHRRRSLMEIPVDLQSEILVRLPVKSILLCKCVCKHFRNVIRNPNFIQTHLTRINPISDHTQSLILAFGYGRNDPWSHFLVSFSNITKDVIAFLPLTPPIPTVGRYNSHDQYDFVGSSNGLIRVIVWQHEYTTQTGFIFFLWNPVIKQCRYLPKSRYTQFPQAVEFGYVAETDDYQIVKVNYESGFYVEVYKMSIDSWIVIDCSTLAGADIGLEIYQEAYLEIYPQETPLYLNGSFHWTFGARVFYILYYKFKDEKLGVMKAVDNDRVLIRNESNHRYGIYNPWKLAVIDESLALICFNYYFSNKLEVWVMNEYGFEDSWTMRYHIVDNILSSLYPVNYWTNGNLLIIEEMQELYLYDLNTRRRMKIPEIETNGKIEAFCSFVETLVPVKFLD